MFFNLHTPPPAPTSNLNITRSFPQLPIRSWEQLLSEKIRERRLTHNNTQGHSLSKMTPWTLGYTYTLYQQGAWQYKCYFLPSYQVSSRQDRIVRLPIQLAKSDICKPSTPPPQIKNNLPPWEPFLTHKVILGHFTVLVHLGPNFRVWNGMYRDNCKRYIQGPSTKQKLSLNSLGSNNHNFRLHIGNSNIEDFGPGPQHFIFLWLEWGESETPEVAQWDNCSK